MVQCLNWGVCLRFPNLPNPECQVFPACSENPLEASTCPLHCVPGALAPQKRNLSQLQLLLKLSFKGGQIPKHGAGRQPRNTATRSFSTDNLASALGSEEALGGQTDPPRTLKPQKQNSKCLQLGLCFFFFPA